MGLVITLALFDVVVIGTDITVIIRGFDGNTTVADVIDYYVASAVCAVLQTIAGRLCSQE